MENQQKNTQEIIKKLQSNSSELIISAIEDIRNQGDESLLSELFKILNNTASSEIQNKIYECISDLKDIKIIPFLISTIKNPDFSSKKREILNAFWQTGFDFSEYADIFTDILIQDSFETGIEALTLLDISADSIQSKKRQELRSKIMIAVPTSDEMKKKLLEQAVIILE